MLEFNYARNLRGQFATGISGLQDFGTGGVYEPSASAVVFVTNHDTERDDSTLDYTDGATYDLANVFMLAWNYGTPTVFSSFTFTDYDQSPPSDANGFVTPVTCGSGWECEHRTMAGMVGFHNATHGDPTVSNWWSDGSNAIAFSRVRRSRGRLGRDQRRRLTPDADVQHRSSAGTYCDLIHGKPECGVRASAYRDGRRPTASRRSPSRRHDAVAILLPRRLRPATSQDRVVRTCAATASVEPRTTSSGWNMNSPAGGWLPLIVSISAVTATVGQRRNRLPDRGQRRVGERDQRRVVEADHRDVLRHPQSPIPRRAHHTERHHVAAADDRRAALGHQRVAGRLAALEREERVRRRCPRPAGPAAAIAAWKPSSLRTTGKNRDGPTASPIRV